MMGTLTPAREDAVASAGESTEDRDDTALVRRAQSGDGRAFESLYRSHVALVRHVARDNVKDPAALDDLVQEVFTRAFVHLPRLREPERFRPWLLSICRRAAIDQRRLRQSSRSVLDPDAGVDTASDAAGPAASAEIRAELASVHDAVARLPRRDALALNLVGHLGFGPAEVAAALGVSTGAAKVVVHRARQRLRAVLDVETEAETPTQTEPVTPTAIDAESGVVQPVISQSTE